MLPIAGQKAGPNELKFCVGTHGWPGSVIGLKNRFSPIFKKKIFFSNFFFQIYFPRATPGPLASCL